MDFDVQRAVSDQSYFDSFVNDFANDLPSNLRQVITGGGSSSAYDEYGYPNPKKYERNLFERIQDWFTGEDYNARYNSAVAAADREREERLIREAREWTANREDTQYQRLMADLKAAGLNPWLALQSGGLSGTSSASSASMQQGGYYKKNENNSGAVGRVLGAIIGAITMLVTKNMTASAAAANATDKALANLSPYQKSVIQYWQAANRANGR